MSRPRLLIFGATGLLGSELTRHLSDKYDIRPLGHHQCDITDSSSVDHTLASERPAIVINAAAWSDVDGCESNPDRAKLVNTEAAVGVARSCKQAGARLVFFSSDYVFGGDSSSPYVENAAPNPINEYGKTKLEAERGIQKVMPEALIVRTAWLYGPGGRDFIKSIVAAAQRSMTGKEKEPLRVVSDQVGNPTSASELSEQLNVLLDGKHGGIYHCTNVGQTSWFEYARLIVDELSLNVDVHPISSKELGRPAARPAYSVLANARLQTEGLDRMRDHEVVLREYLAHYRKRVTQNEM